MMNLIQLVNGIVAFVILIILLINFLFSLKQHSMLMGYSKDEYYKIKKGIKKGKLLIYQIKTPKTE